MAVDSSRGDRVSNELLSAPSLSKSPDRHNVAKGSGRFLGCCLTGIRWVDVTGLLTLVRYSKNPRSTGDHSILSTRFSTAYQAVIN